jgi:D-glycero-beta-D-manno-heptose-7-phosphate kinase
MTRFTSKRLDGLFQKFSDLTIMVVGDVMLDRYLWGKVSRISPEAPVPVVDVESESLRPGGAANVSNNVFSLGARAVPMGVVGKDEEGRALKRLFEEKGFSSEGLIEDPERPTTVKTRVMANGQHVVRADREVRRDIPEKVQDGLIEFFDRHLDRLDGVILEDYNKGLLVPRFIRHVIGKATDKGIRVYVDPKFDHFFEYRGVTLFKPNRKEAAERLGVRLGTDEELQEALLKLTERLECRAVLITLGEEGMILQERGKPFLKVPTKAVKVHDVSGAGDTVIATMAVAMGSGAEPDEAALIANHAAGIVCGEVGIVPIDRDVLLKKLKEEACS